MFTINRKVFRKTGYTGEFGTESGSIQFAEDHSGEGFYFDVWNSLLNENQKVYLSVSDILAIAQIGLITESFTEEQLLEEIPKIVRKNREREQRLKEITEKYTDMTHSQYSMPVELEVAYDEAHRPLTDVYGDALVGGDGTPSEYHVEGWGIQKLNNSDFEVTYKV